MIVVDDDETLVDVFTEILESNKIEVVSAGHNGKQAIELCTKYEPDFLFLDLMMPEFDGYYALERLQKLGIKTKVIVISGSIDEEIKNRLKLYSVFSIQSKPPNIQEILDLVKIKKEIAK